MFQKIALCSLLLTSSLFASAAEIPSVKAAVAPEYPPIAVAGRVSGVVTVRVAIDDSGAVIQASVLQGHPMLKEAALDAAKKWRFEAGSAATISLKFDFTVLPEKAAQESEITFLPPDEIEVRKRPVEPSNYKAY
jgi:TonB family protein